MARAGLTPQIVVDTAIAIVDADGPEALTLAAVAKRAGVATPSLYKHVASLARLRVAVGVRVLDELTERVTTAVLGLSGANAVTAFMLAYRGYVLDYPHRYAAMPQNVVDDPDWHASSDRLLRILYTLFEAVDVTGSDAVDRIRGLRAAAHGFATLQSSGGFQLAEDIDRSYLLLVRRLTDDLP